MPIHRAPQIRTARTLATIAFGVAVLNACSNAAPSPIATTANPTVAPSVARPAGSAGPASLRAAPNAPCKTDGTGTDCIAPGRYALDASLAPATITIDLPTGWFEWDPGGGSEGVLVDGGAGAPDGSGWGLLVSPVGSVSRNPCDPAAGMLPADQAAGIDKIAQAMAGWPGFHASSPRPVAVGGLDGRLVELTYPKGASTCPVATLWTTPSGTPIDGYPMITSSATRPAQFRIVDVGGTIVIIRTTDYPGPSPFEEEQGVKADPQRHADDQLQLRAMVDSIRITP